MKNKSHLLFFSIILVLSSCTIHKRVHQRGYHIAWSATHKTKRQPVETPETSEKTKEHFSPIEIYQPDEILYSSSSSNELVLENKEKINSTNRQDTIVPTQTNSNEEYFDRKTANTPSTIQTSNLPGKEQANLALAFGIIAITSPVWILLLSLTLAAASSMILETLAFFFVIGIIALLIFTVATFVLSIGFLKKHGNDPAYAMYRNRAITGLILASIYPGIVLISIILAMAMV